VSAADSGHYPSSSSIVWSWTSYGVLLPTAALFLAAWMLRAKEVERARPFERGLYRRGKPLLAQGLALLGALTLFAWINLAILDAFETGAHIRVVWERAPGRDLTQSIAWVVYALVLLAIGMARRSVGVRWLSLVFLLLALGKVFLHDLGELEGLYRVVSFLEAAALTLRLTIVALLVACSIGLVFALLRLSRVRALNLVSNAYVYLVRGTPLIVQIFVLYFGLTSVIQMSSFWAAALALAFHNGAYVAEIFRGAIQSSDRGQMEAGRALGMSSALTYRRVVMPQAALRALPPLGNQMIIALKDSSLAAFISMNELFNVATTQGANHFDQMTYLLVVAVYYLALVLVLQLCVQWTETKLGRGIYA
jgi:polar amino acid transport system permease protein